VPIRNASPNPVHVFVALSVAACAGPRAATAPVAAPAPVGAPEPVAPVVVVTPVDARREALVAAWRAANPQSTAGPAVLAGPLDFADPVTPGPQVAGVIGDDRSATLVLTAVPFAEGHAITASLSISGAPRDVIAGLSARDVNGDHRPDLAVFLRSEYELDGYIPFQHFALLFTVHGQPERNLAPLVRAEMRLLGVRDDVALAAALPGLITYEAPAEGLSPIRFLARLGYATPAQFRAAVAPAGLRLCTDLPDRTGNRRRRCVTTPAARLTDSMITGRIRTDLGQFVEVLVDDPNGLQVPSCQRHGTELRCGANIGGPAGSSWAFVGEGSALRIAELGPWAESS